MKNRDCSFLRGLVLALCTMVYPHCSVRVKATVPLWKRSFLIISDIFNEGSMFSSLTCRVFGMPLKSIQHREFCCLSSGMFMFKVLLNIFNSFNIEHIPSINRNPIGTNPKSSLRNISFFSSISSTEVNLKNFQFSGLVLQYRERLYQDRKENYEVIKL